MGKTNKTEIRIDLTPEEANRFFVKGLNEIIREQGADDAVVAIAYPEEAARDESLGVSRGRRHDLSDDEWAAIVTLGIRKALNLDEQW